MHAINVKSTCSQIVDTISQIVAMGIERKAIPMSIVEELTTLASVAGAIAIQEEKEEAGEWAREAQRPLTAEVERQKNESENPLQGFETFRSRLVEGDVFRRNDATGSEQPTREMFRSQRPAPRPNARSAADWQSGETHEAAANDYDFSSPGAFAARYR